MFDYVPHTADVKVIVDSDSLNGLFSESAKAYSNFVLNGFSKKNKESYSELRNVSMKSENIEALLFDFISELIFLFDSSSFLSFIAETNIEEVKGGYRLDAILKGDLITDAIEDVKAMTYSEMKIWHDKGFHCEFVMDI